MLVSSWRGTASGLARARAADGSDSRVWTFDRNFILASHGDVMIKSELIRKRGESSSAASD